MPVAGVLALLVSGAVEWRYVLVAVVGVLAIRMGWIRQAFGRSKVLLEACNVRCVRS
jgi:hypothetical protein